MQVELNYGRGKLPVQLPDDFQVTVLRKLPVLAAAVYKAFRETVGTAPLEKLARAASSATIAICGITRPMPNHAPR